MSKLNGMTKGVGETMPKRRSDQAGDGEDFAFNGQMGDGVNRMTNRYAHNHWSGHSNDGRTVNMGMGPRKGNASSSAMAVGPSATKDKHQMTIATAAQGGRINGGATVKSFAGSPDKINVGSK
jgi:hypothetical protein